MSRAIPDVKLDNYQKAYFLCICLVSVSVFSPFKFLAYGLPFLSLLIILVASRKRVILLRLLIFSAVYLLFVALYLALYPTFVVSHSIYAVVTYSSILFLLFVPSSGLSSTALLQRTISFLTFVILVEAVIGIIQATFGFLEQGGFSGSNGDRVEGTIHLALEPSNSFSNPMFTANMSAMILFILAVDDLNRGKLSRVAVFLGLLSIVLASVVHMLASLVIATLLALGLLHTRGNWKLKLGGLFLVTLFSQLILLFLESNILSINGYWELVQDQRLPKLLITMDATSIMIDEYPMMPVIGLGPGQFASQAALIGSGLFFGSPQNPIAIPYLPFEVTDVQRKYLISLWFVATESARWGSTGKPFYSWLSLYTEFGAFGMLLVLSWLFVLIRKVQSISQGREYRRRLGVLIWTIFLVFIGFQLNYWESIQSIFLGCLLFKLIYADMLGERTVQR
jgi:hypothetical protein